MSMWYAHVLIVSHCTVGICTLLYVMPGIKTMSYRLIATLINIGELIVSKYVAELISN